MEKETRQETSLNDNPCSCSGNAKLESSGMPQQLGGEEILGSDGRKVTEEVF